MHAIRDVIPVLPVSLVATVFVRGENQAFAEIDLKTKAYDIARQLEAAGAHVRVMLIRKQFETIIECTNRAKQIVTQA